MPAPIDATWKQHPGSHDYDTGANWVGGVPASGTATFGASSIHSLSFSTASNGIDEWDFTAHAANYSFKIADGQAFDFTGTGIVVSGGQATINDDGTLGFFNTSSAGKAHINVSGDLEFGGSSSAAQAVITTDAGATTQFSASSDGDQARFITKANGIVDFANDDFHVGSIEGAGAYDIPDYLVIGSNRSTTVSGPINGGGTIVKNGTGTLTLSHQDNGFSLTELSSGALKVAAIGAAGEEIEFTGSHATLKIGNGALSHNSPSESVFNTTVVEFGDNGNKLDFTGLKFVAHAKASLNTGTGILSVKSGKLTDTIYLSNPHSTSFKAVSDGHGGTEVVVKQPGLEKSDGASAGDHQSGREDVSLDVQHEIAHHDFIL